MIIADTVITIVYRGHFACNLAHVAFIVTSRHLWKWLANTTSDTSISMLLSGFVVFWRIIIGANSSVYLDGEIYT